METWAQLDIRNIVEDPMDPLDKKKLVEETIQKWLFLQKNIKEEITLEEIILKQQEDDFNKLKAYFKNFYELKIKSRKAYEDILNLKLIGDNNNKTEELSEYYIEEKIDTVLLQLLTPITNLLFIFRNNSDYIIKLISLIDFMIIF